MRGSVQIVLSTVWGRHKRKIPVFSTKNNEELLITHIHLIYDIILVLFPYFL